MALSSQSIENSQYISKIIVNNRWTCSGGKFALYIIYFTA